MSEQTAQELTELSQEVDVATKRKITVRVGDAYKISGRTMIVTDVSQFKDFEFVPPDPPAGVVVDSLWKVGRQPWKLTKIEWNAEKRRHRLTLRYLGHGGLEKFVTAKALLANYLPFTWLDHDFADPYLAILGGKVKLCTNCGTQSTGGEADGPCLPGEWRSKFEANVAEHNDHRRYWNFSIAKALEREKQPLPPKTPSPVQSHNLGAGIGVFNLREPAQPPKVTIVSSTTDEYPF